MKAVSILFLAIFIFSVLQITAQVKIYDGRRESTNTKISEAEKQLIENFVRKSEKEIKKFGKSRDFECETDSLQIDSVAEGFFTRKKLQQKAYLYQLCFSGKAQYATYLGGIVIIQNGKPTGHYPFANISGYNNLKSLPDINRNGYSEIAVEFSHSINSQNFAKAIKIFDLAPSGLMEVATLETFSRIGETDAAYNIFAKKDRQPVFLREVYESEPQANDWKKSEKLKKFATNPSVYSSNNLDILPIYEFSAPYLTATEISQRILKLVKSVQTVKDISPQNIEKITETKVEFAADDRHTYGFSGKIADSTWFYGLVSTSERIGKKPNGLRFSFDNTEQEDTDLTPICAVDFETFKKELIEAGFSAKERFGVHGRHLGWDFSKSNISVFIAEQLEKSNRRCVRSVAVYVY